MPRLIGVGPIVYNSKSLSVPHFAAGIQLVLGNPALLTVYQHWSSVEVYEAHSEAP